MKNYTGSLQMRPATTTDMEFLVSARLHSQDQVGMNGITVYDLMGRYHERNFIMFRKVNTLATPMAVRLSGLMSKVS